MGAAVGHACELQGKGVVYRDALRHGRLEGSDGGLRLDKGNRETGLRACGAQHLVENVGRHVVDTGRDAILRALCTKDLVGDTCCNAVDCSDSLLLHDRRRGRQTALDTHSAQKLGVDGSCCSRAHASLGRHGTLSLNGHAGAEAALDREGALLFSANTSDHSIDACGGSVDAYVRIVDLEE